MLESLIYIFKLYIGLFLISLTAWKVRFWDECNGLICLFKYLYRFLGILFVILFFAVKFKTFDAFFVVSLFLLIFGVDFLLAKRSAGTRVNFIRISLNQKIYDFIDGVWKFKFRGIKPKFEFKYVALIFVFLSGLILWIKPALQMRSLSSIPQHNHLVKITSMLMNNFNSGINDFAMNSICAFFSLIFGINQYVVLHLFGAFNYALLFIGISLLTYRLTEDFFTVILSASLFAYLFGQFNFIQNPVEGSSFLLGLAWSFFVLYLWKEMKLLWKAIGLFALLLIDLFIFFSVSVLIFLSGLIESIFKSPGRRELIFTGLIALLIFPAFEIYLGMNPELKIKVYALLYSPELMVYSAEFINFLMLVLFFVLILTSNTTTFYGIFTFLLLIFTLACEMSFLSFVPYEQFYPFIVLLSFVWFAVIVRKIFMKRMFFQNIFISCVVLLVMLNAFLAGGSKLDARIEPDELVDVVLKIQKENLPFAFAIVSHSGTRPMVENWAWFMDWDYFLKNYILINDEKKIYEVVYVLVPKGSAIDKINRSFVPRIDSLSAVLDSVCTNYAYAKSEIYFDGDYVRVYKLKKMKK